MARKATVTKTPVTAAVAPATVFDDSYLEWSPVIGGATVAVAVSIVLGQFGAGVGLSVGEPMTSGGAVSWNILVAGLWVVIMAISASTAAGYLAGRMRRRWETASAHEAEFRDGLHGLVAWGLSTIVAVVTLALISMLGSIGAAAGAADAAGVPDETVRLAANISLIFTFASAAAATLGAAAAWWAATLGGEHRDQGIDVHGLVPAPFRRR